MIYDGALAIGGIFNLGHWVWCLVIGGLIILWIAVGITDLGWINKLTMAALFILTLVLCKVIFFSGSAMAADVYKRQLTAWSFPSAAGRV